ncbi:signal transduction histidine kinase [Methylobacterium sp. 4-46]|uniref:sensor histidine kinase n=1 Tax=unclassified Methylobacterium TaxID=2615210 RepID=UPI000152D8A6|nr:MULTISPECIES: HWE histidine kinase domain-containing protein [Methylobacterium]ACA19887.1 signal transduction histidine kinase [Methylobacterium sp. 4-46]WFT79071.1 HWE histidine kinase domain-containing protein [Methylobacterium nodulans]
MLAIVPVQQAYEPDPLRDLLNGLRDGFIALDERWCFTEMNPAAETHFGRGRESALGAPIQDLILPFAGSEIEARWRHVLVSGEPALFEAPSAVRPDRITEFNVFRFGAGLGVTFRDVTDARQADAALRESQSRLEIATEAARLGVWDWNLLTDEMVYSERACAIHGLSPHAPVTLDMLRGATHPQDLPRTTEMAERALDPAIRERVPYEYRIIRPSDDTVRWVLAHGEAVFAPVDGVERAVRYAGTLQDITAQLEAEEALRSSEGRLRLALDAGRMAVWAYDVATDSVQGSAELNRIYGFPPEACPTLGEFRSRYYPGDRERLTAAWSEARARDDRYFEAEHRCVWPDGSVRWLLLRAETKEDSAGQPANIVGVVLDITARKRAEEHRALLLHELNHRVKNTLATVQAIAHQTFRGDSSDRTETFEARLLALSKAHDLLTRESWEGANLTEIVSAAIAPFRRTDGTRFQIVGRQVWLAPRIALALAMALHELGTNAAKYGALSTMSGRVLIGWSVSGSKPTHLILRWSEQGGPSVVPPTRKGFGTRLIERTLASEMRGDVDISYEPTGVECALGIALDDDASSPPV